MRFLETSGFPGCSDGTAIPGVAIVEIEPHADERGFFARSWCRQEGEAHGLGLLTTQCNISFNTRLGTLRGMHSQAAPYEEIKLVRCTRGSIFDVAVDLRLESPTFGRHVGVELSADNRRALYIPEGCAHGFLTLADDAEIFYLMSAEYSPSHARGFRWNDPFFAIDWPAEVRVISERDRTYPDFTPQSTSSGVDARGALRR
jgi:dTDP-4-dehydrorhamnose 3,5-epimerase